MRLALKGHSKFQLVTDVIDGRSVVIKSAPDDMTHVRLIKQFEKQRESYKYYGRFGLPEIIDEWPQYRSFVMEYLPHQSLVEYLDGAMAYERFTLYGKITNYINFIFQNAERTAFEPSIFIQKIESVYHMICSRADIDPITVGRVQGVTRDLIDSALCQKPARDFIGWCHGDFTLSNLLIDPRTKKIYWFDFMDGWDHSTLIDLAKLDQEIRYGWSLRFCNFPTSERKYHECMEELKAFITIAIQSVMGRPELSLLKLYSAMNDLRLLQYEKNMMWFDRILTSVEESRCT